MPDIDMAQLMQLTTVTWDGNAISKKTRDQLVEQGLVQRWGGWNWLTLQGVKLLDHTKHLKC